MKWLVATGLILVAAIVYRLNFLVYAIYALLGMLLLNRFLVREWIENLSGARQTDSTGEPLQIGDRIHVTVAIKNESHFRIPWLLVEDALAAEALIQNPPRLRASGPRLALISIPGGEERILDYEVEFLMRGYYQIGPLMIESGDLFGLDRRYRVLTEPEFILVLPKVVPLQGYDLTSRRPVGEIRMTHRLFEDPSRISGVRDYEHGDSLHRIHWRASARVGHLQSKIYEPSSIAGATILLDFHQATHDGRGEVYCTELAVTACASIANALTQLGQRTGLITNGRDAADRIREEGWDHQFRNRSDARAQAQMLERSDRLRPIVVETRRGDDQFDRILQTLARLELTDGLTFSQLIDETASRISRNASVIAVLTQVPPETAVSLGGLRRRGFSVTVVLVAFDRPHTSDWAQQPDWAAWLLAAGVEIRQIHHEDQLAQLCSGRLLR